MDKCYQEQIEYNLRKLFNNQYSIKESLKVQVWSEYAIHKNLIHNKYISGKS